GGGGAALLDSGRAGPGRERGRRPGRARAAPAGAGGASSSPPRWVPAPRASRLRRPGGPAAPAGRSGAPLLRARARRARFLVLHGTRSRRVAKGAAGEGPAPPV